MALTSATGNAIRKEVKNMAEITAELFDSLLGKLEELADADPGDQETIQRLQTEVGELTLRAASQDAKYGWINDNDRQARVARLAEKVGLATPLPPTGPEAPLPSVPASEVPVEDVTPVADSNVDSDLVVANPDDVTVVDDDSDFSDSNDIEDES
jgi:hypothetical protein